MKRDLLKTLSRAHLGILRLCLLTIGLMMWGNTAWADDVIYPSKEYNYRPDYGKTDTDWDSSTPKDGSSNTIFELNSKTFFIAIHQYKIPDFNKKKVITLKLTQSNDVNYEVGVWDYPYNSTDTLPSASSTSSVYLKTAVKAVTGLDWLGGTTSFKDPIDKQKPSSKVLTFTIPSSKLTIVGYAENGDALVNILITTTTYSSNQKVTYYTNNSSNTATNKPYITVADYVPSTHPVKEYGYRPQASGTGYDSSTPKAGSSNTSLEMNYNARLFIIQQYEIPDFSTHEYITLTFKRYNSGGTPHIGVWDYPYNGDNDIPTSTSVSNATLISNLANVTGWTPWNTAATFKDPIKSVDNAGTFTLTIPTSKLTVVSTNDYGSSLVNLLITNTDYTDGDSKAQIYTYNTSNTESNWPTLSYPAVCNVTTSVGYSDIKTAVSAAKNGETVKLLENQTLSSRIEMPALAKDETITVNGNNKSIIRKSDNTDNLMILVSCDNAATFTFKNLVVDGNNVTATKDAIEVNKSATFENCSFINHNIASGYAIIKSASANAVIAGTTTLKDNGTSHVFYIKQDKRIDDNDAVYTDGTSAVVPTIELESSFDSDELVVRNIASSKSQISTKKYIMANDYWTFTEVTEGTDKYSLKAVYVPAFSESRTTKTGSYGTICLPYDATADNAVVMEFTGRTSEGMVFTPIEGTTISAGVPYLYRATADNQTFTTTGTSYSDAKTTDKGFAGSYEKKELSVGQYLLSSGVWRFAKASTEDANHTYVYVGAYKCYFPTLPDVEGAGSAKAGSVTFGIEIDETTGINYVNLDANVNNATDGKFMKNGQLVIMKNGKMYNTAGQEVK